MKSNTVTKAQFSHAVRQEAQYLLSEDVKKMPNKKDFEKEFRARLEKSLKSTGAYGELLKQLDNNIEECLKLITHSIQECIMETVILGHSPRASLTTLIEETTKIIENDSTANN
jgi:predicted P-loop ATPase/GTPase